MDEVAAASLICGGFFRLIALGVLINKAKVVRFGALSR